MHDFAFVSIEAQLPDVRPYDCNLSKSSCRVELSVSFWIPLHL